MSEPLTTLAIAADGVEANEPIHWLVVDPTDDYPFEIEHPGCTLIPGNDRYPDQYDCRVEFEALNAGLDFFFVRAGDQPTGWHPETLLPGRYLIEPWEETYRGHEHTEYDAGLRLVYPEEAQSA